MRMAKISLILSFIPLMVNAWVTQYLPNKVPIHYTTRRLVIDDSMQ